MGKASSMVSRRDFLRHGRTLTTGMSAFAAGVGASMSGVAGAVDKPLTPAQAPGPINRDQSSNWADVRAFGALGDGKADDTQAFREALEAVDRVGGGTVLIPPGSYRISSTLVPGERDVWIVGAGMGVTILHQDGDGFRVFSKVSKSSAAIGFRDFTMHGNLERNPKLGGDDDRHVRVKGFRRVVFAGIESLYCRNMALTANTCAEVEMTGCRVRFAARDACNFTGSSRVKITNNTIEHCGDDLIAAHVTANQQTPPREGIIVANNYLEDGFGIKIQGGVKTLIANNIISRPHSYGIRLGVDARWKEGLNDVMDLVIQNNIITDPINPRVWGRSYGLNYGIFLHGSKASGEAVPPEDFWYASNASDAPKTGGGRILISGNVVSKTLKNVGAYSDWGYGKLFTNQGEKDPEITGHIGSGDGIRIAGGSCQDVQVTNNYVYGFGRGIRLGDTNRVRRVFIESNKLVRIREEGVSYDGKDLSGENAMLRVDGNFFDLDPLNEHKNRRPDGGWTRNKAARPLGVSAKGLMGVAIESNWFRNLYAVAPDVGDGSLLLSGNTLICEPAAVGDHHRNKGIRIVDIHGEPRLIAERSDPSKLGFGDLIASQGALSANAAPSSGFYLRGQFVRNTDPRVEKNGKLLLGWTRLTTGRKHLLGTDWIETYAEASRGGG